MKSFKEYILATRPWSFPVSAMPVLTTAAYLFSCGYQVSWRLTALALVGIVLFHAAANTFSDYFDYRQGVDARDTQGATMLRDGVFTLPEMLRLSILLFILAIATGCLLAFLTDPRLWLIGGIGLLLSVCYPWLKFHALGDLDIFFNFGVLPVLGTSLVATGEVHWDALWLVLAFATITVAVLHANNTRDVVTDRRAHIHTFAMLIGHKASMFVYQIEVLLPSLWVIVCVAVGKMSYFALIMLCSLKIAVRNCKVMKASADDIHAIDHLDEMTAQQQLISSLLLALSLLISGIIANL